MSIERYANMGGFTSLAPYIKKNSQREVMDYSIAPDDQNVSLVKVISLTTTK